MGTPFTNPFMDRIPSANGLAAGQGCAGRNRSAHRRRLSSACALWVALAALLLAGRMPCAAETNFMGFTLNKNSSLRGIMIPIGGENVAAPTLRVFIEEISVERKSSGNMTFGVVPQIVLRGMKVQIMDQGGVGEWQALLSNFATREASLAGTKIREFELAHQNKEALVVKAETAGFGALDATLQLRQVRVYKKGQLLKAIKSARIPMSGPQAGQLVWNEGAQCASLPVDDPEPGNPVAAAAAPAGDGQPKPFQ